MSRLVAAEVFIVGKSKRWVNTRCREGQIPGAKKILGVWFIDVDAYDAANDAAPPVEEDSIEAQVRARFRCTAGGGR